LQEAVQNVLKHSESRGAHVSLHAQVDTINLTVTAAWAGHDDSCGRASSFPTSETGFSACRRKRRPGRGEMPFPARCGSAWPQP
jgi:hypothetical protein